LDSIPRVAFLLAELVELTPGYCGNAFGVKRSEPQNMRQISYAEEVEEQSLP
jgi:hypothetical protein